ncbi:MAG: hypothetical protein ACYDCM_07225 [Candidatus Acidiferrales bacterium]
MFKMFSDLDVARETCKNLEWVNSRKFSSDNVGNFDAYLRSYLFDGSESFMAGGHQIVKTRHNRRSIPAWAQDPDQVKAILLRAFPNLQTSFVQKERAGKWLRVIYLYWQAGFDSVTVCLEMGVSRSEFKNILQRIRRVAAGQRANGSGIRKPRAKHYRKKKAQEFV